jgi:hypothetical protein
MINQQFYRVGEMIDGMKIINIERDHITLQDGDRTIQLQAVI